MIEILIESKEDIQRFIDKFGKENYDKVKTLANSPTLKKMKLNDLTFCVSRYSKKWMEMLLADCEKEVYLPKFNNRFGAALAYRFDELIQRVKSRELNDFVMDNETGEILDEAGERLNYKYWLKMPKRELISFIKEWGYTKGEKIKIENGTKLIKSSEDGAWKLYKITNYLASEYYGMGSGWCISGAYPGKYDNGEDYFYGYSDDGYYFIINEEADERYCVFYDDDDALEMWDGSHGKDSEFFSLDEVDIPYSFVECLENSAFSQVDELPVFKTRQQQYKFIKDYLPEEDLYNFLDNDIFYEICDKNDSIFRLAGMFTIRFLRFDKQKKINMLKEFTDLSEEELSKPNITQHSKILNKSILNKFKSVKEFINYEEGKDFEDLEYNKKKQYVSDCGIMVDHLARYYIDIDEGYGFCVNLANIYNIKYE